MKIVVKRF